VPSSPSSICLTGATGWLGRSLLSIGLKNPTINFSIFGRQDSTLNIGAGEKLQVKKFDVERMTSQSFDVFAPFAFLTRDRALNLKDEDYCAVNRRLIADAVNVVRGGNVGALLNISSGAVSGVSDYQRIDKSYLQYAELKRIQEEEFANACSDMGIPFINCRVFSLTGIDMQEPTKYAFGDLILQALTKGVIELNSRSLVTRRYMDSRDLMYLLVKLVGKGRSSYLESGGQKVNLVEIAKMILTKFNLDIEAIRFKTDHSLAKNEYFSDKNDFESISKYYEYNLAPLEVQLNNVTHAVKNSFLL
jgi:nucleoside-diphosphate-sugar epimerase